MVWFYKKLCALVILQTCESYGFMKIMRVGVFYKRLNPNGFMKIMLVGFLQTYES